MKKAKLSDYYDLKDYAGAISGSMIDEPILKASADIVQELEVTKIEYPYVMMFSLANHIYHQVIFDGGAYHSVLGMKLTIIE